MQNRAAWLAMILAIWWVALCGATEIIPRERALQMGHCPDSIVTLNKKLEEKIQATYKKTDWALLRWIRGTNEMDEMERFVLRLNFGIEVARCNGMTYWPTIVGENNFKSFAVAAARAGYHVRYCWYDNDMIVETEFIEAEAPIVVEACRTLLPDQNGCAKTLNFDDIDFFVEAFSFDWGEAQVVQNENAMSRARFMAEHA